MHYDAKTHAATCSKATLLALIEHTSDDETRPHINSICFDLPKNCAVATDGHRLARCMFDVPSTEAKDAKQVLVSRDVAVKAAKLAGKSGVVIDFSENAIFDVESKREESFRIAFKPIEATFPPYEQVIPVHGPKLAGVPVPFSAKYLRSLFLITTAAKSFENQVEFFPPPDDLSPCVFRVSGTDSSWTVIIMPQRRNSGESLALKDCRNVTVRDVPAAKKKAPAPPPKLPATPPAAEAAT